MQTKVAILRMTVALGAVACAGKAAPIPHSAADQIAPVDEPYRPGWTAAIGLHIDEIRLCLADREAPTAVVHVQALATGATGVTAVDGLGQLENCAVADGHVLVREPAALEPADLEGLPVFTLAPERPHVGVGVLVEEVSDADSLLGWLYWPLRDTSQ